MEDVASLTNLAKAGHNVDNMSLYGAAIKFSSQDDCGVQEIGSWFQSVSASANASLKTSGPQPFTGHVAAFRESLEACSFSGPKTFAKGLLKSTEKGDTDFVRYAVKLHKFLSQVRCVRSFSS